MSNQNQNKNQAAPGLKQSGKIARWCYVLANLIFSYQIMIGLILVMVGYSGSILASIPVLSNARRHLFIRGSSGLLCRSFDIKFFSYFYGGNRIFKYRTVHLFGVWLREHVYGRPKAENLRDCYLSATVCFVSGSYYGGFFRRAPSRRAFAGDPDCGRVVCDVFFGTYRTVLRRSKKRCYLSDCGGYRAGGG